MNMKIAQLFKRARLAHHLTQQELGAAAGLDSAYVSRVERGQRGIEIGKGIALAEALGILDELICTARPKTKTQSNCV